MNCKNCNNVLPSDAKFCNKCGSEVKANPSENNEATVATATDSAPVENTGGAIIKCGNCGYIGLGEKNRSLTAKILAWICVVFAPLITILYFVATHKYRCPKCKSTFLGVKNKEGVFAGQMGGATRWVFIIIIIFVGIAIIGILSSVVLASLNSARQKGADASVKANLASLRVEGVLYEDSNKSYTGFCDDFRAMNSLKSASKSASLSQSETNYVCNDISSAWAVSVPLRGGGYWCVDSSESDPRAIDAELTTQVSCSGGKSYDGTNTISSSVNWANYTSSKDGFSIMFPRTPTLDAQENLPVEDMDATYSWHSYESEDDSSSYFVYKYIYSTGLDTENPDNVLKVFLNSTLSSSNGKLVSSSYTYQGGNRAMNFEIKSGDEVLKGRYILVGEELYLIMMDYFPASYDADSYNKFINSFKTI